jgi:charged multivesicular body protein 2A
LLSLLISCKEIVTEQKRGIQRNQRDLDRDLLNLDRSEKQITAEIQKLAKQNQMGSAKILAKELVRIRGQREKIYNMKATLSGVSTRTTTMAAQSYVFTLRSKLIN